MTDLVTSARDGGVLTLTFNRPDKKNAITEEMYLALAAELTAAEADPAVRAVLFLGAGDSFTAGNDIRPFSAANDAAESAGPKVSPAQVFIQALVDAKKPLIAGVHGRAVGIGVTMLLHCDLVVVAEDAKLSTPFVGLGLAPEAASSLLLVERVGQPRAFALFATGLVLSGEEAAAWGIANRAVPAAEVAAAAGQLAKAVAAQPPGAVQATKALMRDPARLTAQTERERVAFSARLRSAEAKEAFAAFRERRPPDFSKLAAAG